MQTIKKYSEISMIPDATLREYISYRAQELMKDYDAADLDEIGCFVILDGGESGMFLKDGMEFVEKVVLAGTEYLHGVRILGDCYGEDVYLMVKEVEHHV